MQDNSPEQSPSPEFDQNQRIIALIDILTTDYTPREVLETLANPHATDEEKMKIIQSDPAEAEERFASQEGRELYEEVIELLDTAPTTEIFKDICAAVVVQAYSYRSTVDELMSPIQLGFMDGPGIFGEETVTSIEANCLSSLIRSTVAEHVTFNPLSAQNTCWEVIDSEEFSNKLCSINGWIHDFIGKYGSDPLSHDDAKSLLAQLGVMSASNSTLGYENVMVILNNL